MSSFLVAPETIEKISSVMCAIVNDELPGIQRDRIAGYWLKRNTEEMQHAGKLNYKEMCFRLYGLNVRALVGRYGDDLSEYDPEKTGYTFNKRPSASAAISDKYALYKSIQCYHYQCAEDASIGDPLYYIVEQLQHTIAEYIVTTSAQYEAADWN